MRTIFLLIAVVWNVGLPQQMIAQETKLPESLKTLPANTAFFYGVHNGADFLKMLAGSELAKQLAVSSISEISAQDIVESLDFDAIEIDFEEAAEDARGAIEPHQADYEAFVSQLMRNDVILAGDESWSKTRESICDCILIVKENISLVETKPDVYRYEGLDELLSAESFANVRIPNTLVSFQLTDIAPATRLIAEMVKSAGEQTKEQLGDWTYQSHMVGDDQLMAFSYPLLKLVEPKDDEKLTKDDWEDRQKLADRFRDRSFQVAIGLVQSRFVFFMGEEIEALKNLVGVAATPRLVAQKELELVLPQDGDVLIASAYVSDRFAKSANALGDKGIFTNLTDLVGSIWAMVKVDDVPVQQAVMAFGFPPEAIVTFGSKLKSIGERWDALAGPKAGWSATICAAPSGIIGRGVTFTVDPRLPEAALSVDQHVGDEVVAFHARQGTTTSARLMLGYEFFSQLYIGFTSVMIEMMGEEEETEGMGLHFQRLNQMPIRLAAIIDDRWLPALGDGGQAIVVTRFDPTPDEYDNMPIEFSLVSGVVNDQDLRNAGDLIRRWANSWVNQYYEIIKKTDPEEDLTVPTIDPPMIANDGDSDVFTFVQLSENSEELADEEPQIDLPWDLTEIGTMFHWRLSTDVLAMGSNVLVTKKMLAKQTPIPSDRGLATGDGVVRSVTWIDFDQIAKIFNSAREEDAQEVVRAIRNIDWYHRITTTNKNKTIRRWKLSMPLGDKPE